MSGNDKYRRCLCHDRSGQYRYVYAVHDSAADAALDGNDALEQYYGMMAVLSLTGAYFGFNQAMKEAGVTAGQLAVAKENASIVTDSNIDINNTTVLPVSGGFRGSAAGKGNSSKFYEVCEAADNYTLSDDIFNNHILDRHGPIGNVITAFPKS